MKKIIITDSSTLYSALQKLQDSSGTCLIVIDNKKKLLGTLSDGDVRRAILRGKKLTEKVKVSAKLMDIQLLDHIIVTDQSYFSFADEGMI